MKVRCIDNVGNYGICESLTVGKIYNVVDTTKQTKQTNIVTIINDTDEKIYIYTDGKARHGKFEIVKENEMTKNDLVVGKHVIETRDGRLGLRIGCGFVDDEGKALCHISNINDDLTGCLKHLDIMLVYEVNENYGIPYSLNSYMKDAKEVWRRDDKHAELMQKIAEAEKVVAELKAQAEQLK